MFRTANDTIINEEDLTTTNITSEILDLTNIYLLSFQHVSTGTISGSVKLQLSNDKLNWVDQATTTTVSGAGTALASFADIAAKWGRLVYVATSGTTNTLLVHINTKGI